MSDWANLFQRDDCDVKAMLQRAGSKGASVTEAAYRDLLETRLQQVWEYSGITFARNGATAVVFRPGNAGPGESDKI